MTWEVGQTVYLATTERGYGSYWATITKIGRRWVEARRNDTGRLSFTVKFDKDSGRSQDNGYSSNHHAFPSEEAWNDHQRTGELWHALKQEIGRYSFPRPDAANIIEAARLLGAKLPEGEKQ